MHAGNGNLLVSLIVPYRLQGVKVEKRVRNNLSPSWHQRGYPSPPAADLCHIHSTWKTYHLGGQRVWTWHEMRSLFHKVLKCSKLISEKSVTCFVVMQGG